MSFEVDLDLIRTRRMSMNITATSMAERLGFPNTTKYSRRESGEYQFKADELPAIANILHIPLSKIFIQNDSKIAKQDA